jgi:hypothetical protein
MAAAVADRLWDVNDLALLEAYERRAENSGNTSCPKETKLHAFQQLLVWIPNRLRPYFGGVLRGNPDYSCKEIKVAHEVCSTGTPACANSLRPVCKLPLEVQTQK